MRTSNGDLVTVPDEASLPFDRAVRVVFKVDCVKMPNIGEGLFALGHLQYIAYV